MTFPQCEPLVLARLTKLTAYIRVKKKERGAVSAVRRRYTEMLRGMRCPRNA